MPGQLQVEDLVALLDVTHQLRRTLIVGMKESTGLTLEQALILCRIDINEGDITVSELARAVYRTNHTVSAMTVRLEAMRLVERQRNEVGDRRRVWIRLTPSGHIALEGTRKTLEESLDAILSPLDEQSRQQVYQAISVLGNVMLL